VPLSIIDKIRVSYCKTCDTDKNKPGKGRAGSLRQDLSQTICTDPIGAISSNPICTHVVGTVSGNTIGTYVIGTVSRYAICTYVIGTVSGNTVGTDMIGPIGRYAVGTNTVRTIGSDNGSAQGLGVVHDRQGKSAGSQYR
jgi:hypothetical protein